MHAHAMKKVPKAKITIAQTDEEITECFSVMAQLRPNLKEKEFLPTIRRQYAEGYRLAFIRSNGTVVAVIGFRLLHGLFFGRYIYVDDLITSEVSRSKGFGGILLNWLCDYAKAERCARIELDSGVQRFAAHRFYLRHRMNITCHHFSLEL